MATHHSLVLVALLAAACMPSQQKAVCEAAEREARSLAARGETEQAREQLSVAKNNCPPKRDKYIDELSSLIERRETAIRKEAERARAKEENTKDAPLREFVRWINARMDAPERNAVEVQCFERTHAHHGWCETTHTAKSGTKMVARYWKEDSTAHRFSVRMDVPSTCSDVGENRAVRRWSTKDSEGATIQRTHCEFLSQRLRGRKALIAQGAGWSEVQVFSNGFLERDDAFRKIVEREGWNRSR